MNNEQIQNEIELSSYPLEYSLEDARENGDIILYGVLPFNTKRLQLFIYNVINKTPDKVVLTKYGIDGYPTIGILEYTGNDIIYTDRYYFDNKLNYVTYYGYNIIEKYRKRNDRLLRDYYLQTYDNDEIILFYEPLNYQ
jgi:hypothetical protein